MGREIFQGAANWIVATSVETLKAVVCLDWWVTADLSRAAGSKDPLFDPADVRWTRVSPKLARVWQVTVAIWFGPLALAGVIATAMTRVWGLAIPTALVAAIWASTAWLAHRRAHAIGYLEREADLIIRKGILFRSLKIVPYGRMQYLNVTAGPLDRAFGLAKLQLNTAAASLTAALPGLEPAEAARLRDRLAERGNARMAGL
ncbi:MAG: PH domain-containing protein [Bifidobacteriaceae bacterium]|jgi:membrane protein YdbS with pleckstrin-like domain|nr:PH domain-containing protein [Bifidobacteriaceae bacterium]